MAADWYDTIMKTTLPQYQKCSQIYGDYVEKLCNICTFGKNS